MKLLARAEWRPLDGAPPPLKRASPAGRALVALAKRLGPHPESTGVYQALGAEKLVLTQRFADRVIARGFSGLKATAPVLEHSGYGPFVSLSLELGLRGPFWTLEADRLAGGAALQQASADLALGRCERALVGSCGVDASAFLLVLEPGGRRATFSWSATRHDPPDDDLHGVRTLGEKLEHGGEVQLQTADGRGLTVRLT